MTDSTIAKLTINKPGEMSDSEREEICKWLKRQAKKLQSQGHEYSNKRFVARYLIMNDGRLKAIYENVSAIIFDATGEVAATSEEARAMGELGELHETTTQ